jgi:hypothetical protein
VKPVPTVEMVDAVMPPVAVKFTKCKLPSLSQCAFVSQKIIEPLKYVTAGVPAVHGAIPRSKLSKAMKLPLIS